MAIRGENIGTAYIKVIADGDDLDGEGIGKKAAKDFDKGWTKELKKRLDDDKTLEQAMKRKGSAIKGQITRITNQLPKALRGAIDATDDWNKSIKRALDAFAEAEDAFDRPIKRSERLRESLRKIKPGDAFRDDGRLTKFGNNLDLIAAKANVAGDRIGRIFGKGARNNFVNIMGIVIGRLSNIPGLLASAGSGFINFGKRIVTAFDEAGGGVFGVLAGFQKLAGPLVAFGAGLVGLTLVVGSFVSVMSLAAGAVVALAASLTFALAGAIGVAAGAMVPLVAAVGVAILAFKNMDAEQKRAFRGVGRAFKDLGQSGADSMFDAMGDSIGKLSGAIKQLEPVVDGIAGALGGVFLSWIEGLQSPATQGFLTMLSQTLPRMVTSLGAIFRNIGGALAGIWTQATPFVQEFLSWLTGVTNQWAIFANSKLGGEKITTFFEHMRSSLISVSGFLGEVTGLIGDLFSAGRKPGDDIFDSMTKGVKGWRDALKADPDILKNWFNDAKKFAGVLGDVVVQFGHLVDVLDSPTMRKVATGTFGLIADAFKAMQGPLKVVVDLIGTLDGDTAKFLITIGAGFWAFSKFNAGVASMSGKLKTAGIDLKTAAGRMLLMQSGAKAAAGPIGLALLVDASGRAEGALGSLESALGGALTGFAVTGSPWGAIIGGVGGGLLGMWQAGKKTKKGMEDLKKANEEAASSARDSSADWTTLKNTLNDVTGATTQATREFVANKLAHDGTLQSLKDFNVTGATVVDAIMGETKARREVTQAIEDQRRRGTNLLTQAKNEAVEYNNNAENMTGAEQTRAEKRIKGLEDQGNALVNNATKLEKWVGDTRAAGKEVREAAGASKDWDKILKGFPEHIITKFEAGNIPATKGAAKKLIDQYNLTPPQIKTLFKNLGIEVSDKEMKAIIARAKEVDKQQPDIKITADASGALGPISAVDLALAALPGSKDIDIRVETIKSTRTLPPTAAGGIFSGAQARLIGEAGAEAVVPLNRPLSQVDPAVRELSAIAQGLKPAIATASGGVVNQRPVELTIITPTQDPYAVAKETINHLLASGY